MEVVYKAIGVVHTPFKQPRGTPIQPSAAANAEGIVEVFEKFADGLCDLQGFSHIILLYHFHLVSGSALKVKPYMDTQERGVFATRSPRRPNPIGMSVVRLMRVEGNRLFVRGVDILDGTPLLDIKPYVPQFNAGGEVRIGWLEKNIVKLPRMRDDGRFV